MRRDDMITARDEIALALLILLKTSASSTTSFLCFYLPLKLYYIYCRAISIQIITRYSPVKKKSYALMLQSQMNAIIFSSIYSKTNFELSQHRQHELSQIDLDFICNGNERDQTSFVSIYNIQMVHIPNLHIVFIVYTATQRVIAQCNYPTIYPMIVVDLDRRLGS